MKSNRNTTGGKQLAIKKIKNQTGYSLVEILVAIAILGVIVAAFALGLISSFRAVAKADELQTARTIAEKQMEYVLSIPYNATSYAPLDISTDYPGYSINDPIIPDPMGDTSDVIHYQKISIIVYYDSQQVITLEDYKVQR